MNSSPRANTEEGARTLDHWIHNPVLYQLSYLGIAVNKHHILRHPNSEAKSVEDRPRIAPMTQIVFPPLLRFAKLLWSRSAFGNPRVQAAHVGYLCEAACDFNEVQRYGAHAVTLASGGRAVVENVAQMRIA